MIDRVLVTGASRGIGRAVAERLLAEGRRVAVVARDVAPLAALAGAEPIARDLAADPRGVIAEAHARLGGLDGLVHAAGVAEHRPLAAVTDAQLDRAEALHVRAPFHLTRELADHLRAEGRGGSAVFLGSTLARRPAPGTLAYAVSKAGLEALTRGLALELAELGLRVNAIHPGVVDTAMVRAPRLLPGEPEPKGEAREARVAAQLEALRALHPLGRLGTPEEVAATVVHALDAPWMTGSVITLDGGLSIA